MITLESLEGYTQPELQRAFDNAFDMPDKLQCLIYAKAQKGWEDFADEMEADYDSEMTGRFGEDSYEQRKTDYNVDN